MTTYPQVIDGALGRYERWDVARHTEPFVELCADAEVMRFLGGPAAREVTEASSEGIAAHWDTYGFGLWAVIEPSSGRVAGFAGACYAAWLPGYEHEIELGWRLARWAWGRGLATEGGRLALGALASTEQADHVIAIVDPRNTGSLAVCRRLDLEPRDETINPRLDTRVQILARMLDTP